MKSSVGSMFNQIEGLNLEKFLRGKVVANQDPLGEGRLQIYVSSLVTEETKYQDKLVERKKVLSAEDIFENFEELTYSKEITESNAIWFRPASFLFEKDNTEEHHSGSYKIPKVNTTLIVYFENGDPNKPYWLPFSPTLEGEVITGKNIGKSIGGRQALTNWKNNDLKPNLVVFMEDTDDFITIYDSNSKHYSILFPNGHQIAINNNSDANGIDLATASGHIVSLSDKDQRVVVRSSSGFSVVLDDGSASATISSSGGSSTIRLTGSEITQKAARISLN